MKWNGNQSYKLKAGVNFQTYGKKQQWVESAHRIPNNAYLTSSPLDFDECIEKDNVCGSGSQECINKIGSYICTCVRGYKPDGTKFPSCIGTTCFYSILVL